MGARHRDVERAVVALAQDGEADVASGRAAQPPDDGFFEQVDFIGGVGPGNNWVLSGWANFSDN